MLVSQFLLLIRDSVREWHEDHVPRLSAALSFYTLFALGPVLVIILGIASLYFSESAARGEITSMLQDVIGRDGALLINSIIKNANKPTAGILATTLGSITLLAGTIGWFGQLQDAMFEIWHKGEKPKRSILKLITEKFMSFSLILIIAFLLLLSILITTLLSGFGAYINSIIPFDYLLAQSLNLIISCGIITILFALIYLILPPVDIEWADVIPGAFLAAFLFTLGKFGISYYLTQASPASPFGAAGSIIIILIWIYYSSQILLFGAEFTKVYTRKYGSLKR